jgi:ADP-ribosyl-[dinitrogen reductase] hydrolase
MDTATTTATIENHGLGAVLGALVGDAAGAYLEFLGRKPREDEVERALRMPGGGVWRVAPGQITDDGELAMCLLRALAAAGGFDEDRVAANYVAWYESPPFDIGGTTAAALRGWRTRADGDMAGAAEGLRTAAARASMGSKANGSLMRAAPLGVWGTMVDEPKLVAACRADSALTHPNGSCCDAVAAYNVAIATLIRTTGDRKAAIAATEAWAAREACEEVREWLALGLSGHDEPFHPQAGFIRIAFIHAFRHLAAGSDYVTALRATLGGGGDTDTNACIVGGLIGAAVGAEAIPGAMREAVLHSDHSLGRKRPAFLHPRDVPALVGQLLHARRS